MRHTASLDLMYTNISQTGLDVNIQYSKLQLAMSRKANRQMTAMIIVTNESAAPVIMQFP